MNCAWKELLAVLPAWMRKDVDREGRMNLRELRIHINSPPELVLGEGSICLNRPISREDIQYMINAASRYSPWSAVTTAQGYLTATGGHRMGFCGETVLQQGRITGMKNITSLSIRVARDFPGIAERAAGAAGSILILGPPGWGKTTLLRDLIRQLAPEERICVVDERKELFPEGLCSAASVDVLSGCPKREGISMVLRTMGPSCIAVDEITDPEDALALLQASNCGVRLLATAHGGCLSDFQLRRIYRPLWQQRVFDTVLVLKRDQTYTMERMKQWDTNGSVRY